MRVHRLGDQSAEKFSNLLLDIGNGNIEIDPTDGMIDVPDSCGTIVNKEDMLIESVYPEFSQSYTNMEWLFERAILAPRNDFVGNINTKLLKQIPGEETIFNSIDTVAHEEATQYTTEFPNSLNIAGMPPHKLELKVGSPIMLMRNLDAPKLCNGTRMVVKHCTQE